MIVKTFYRNQRELAESLNNLVDMYWKNELDENVLRKNIKKIFINNADKFLKFGKFTKILQQQCGKKRLEIINKIIVNENKERK